MHKLSTLAAALAVGSLISLPVLAADEAPAEAAAATKPAAAKSKGGGVFATVNGVAIPQSAADAFISEQKAQGAPEGAELRNAVREELIRRELLAQEAKKKGLDKQAAIAIQADLARQAIYVRAFIQDYVKKHPISDETLKADYDKIKAQLGGSEYKTRHILVEKEDDAKAIIAKLKGGAKFEDLAKQSKDPGSKDNGGDLGWGSPANYVKPFADALTKLQKGKFSETPVKTEFGYHVILQEDARPLTPPPFDAIKPQLAQRAQQQQIEKMVNDLRSKAKVE
ncbi:peptidylprolyl isomerase [Rhodocyclus tenuis]|uniref:peptidylprolyl isomerase n=1 Tax=Rhodocyclus tenuis TaxID=1066 RepID=UPI0019067185|nr:peptidylprolyl isomerase [Rhodocyclus tenuis]MBK1679855.1 peptidylprolyl isomerase [Rhodocyclus tenuis]